MSIISLVNKSKMTHQNSKDTCSYHNKTQIHCPQILAKSSFPLHSLRDSDSSNLKVWSPAPIVHSGVIEQDIEPNQVPPHAVWAGNTLQGSHCNLCVYVWMSSDF